MVEGTGPGQKIRDVQHFGEEGGVVPVIDVAATSTFMNPGDMAKAFQGEIEGCYLYSRHSNPTVAAFAKKLAAMEGTEAGLGTASGMAAISCALLQILSPEGHMVCSRSIYGGSFALFQKLFPKWGLAVTFVDDQDPAAFARAIRPNTRVFYTETMSNPLLGIPNLRALAELAHAHAISLVVDNTFAPLLVSPIKLGADVVVYSCTKYISGASDLIAGAVLGTQAFIKSLIDVNDGAAMLLGPVMDPRIAHELYCRLDHLPARMLAHSRAAEYLCAALDDAGIKVFYPGLKSHPQHALFNEIKNDFGYGGMLTVDCGSAEHAQRLASKLQVEKFGLYAVSLGFSRTLICCPALSTASEIPEADREQMGLVPGLLRISLGYVGDNHIMTRRFLDCYAEVIDPRLQKVRTSSLLPG